MSERNTHHDTFLPDIPVDPEYPSDGIRPTDALMSIDALLRDLKDEPYQQAALARSLELIAKDAAGT